MVMHMMVELQNDGFYAAPKDGHSLRMVVVYTGQRSSL